MASLRFVSSCTIVLIAIVAAQFDQGAGADQPSALTSHQKLPTAVAAQLVPALVRPPIHFAKVVSYHAGGMFASYLAIADLNGDGHPDLVVINGGSNSVGVLLGNGDGTFQAAVTYNSGDCGPPGCRDQGPEWGRQAGPCGV